MLLGVAVQGPGPDHDYAPDWSGLVEWASAVLTVPVDDRAQFQLEMAMA